jgi:hypothetical protein
MAIVYIHRRLDIEDDFKNVFYVGIGKSEKRAYTKASRNKRWNAIINKHGYSVQITHKDISHEEACVIEKYLISFYGRDDLGFGNLCNLTIGGDTTNGFKFSIESRKKMSEKRKEYFKKDGALEKNRIAQKLAYSSPDKRKMRKEISILLFEKIPNLRDIISQKTKEAMQRPDVKKNIYASKAISQRTPEFREKMSIIGKNRSLETKEKQRISLKNYYKDQKNRDNISLKNKKKIIQLDIEENFVKLWDSITEASLYLKIDMSSIIRCCRGKQNHAGKQKFKYYESNTSNQQ